MIKIHDVEQGTPEWHELRAGKYTGSNAHKLLRFGTIDYSKSANTGFKGNFYTKRGHILEAEAIELYEAIHRCTVSRPGFVTNSDYPTCGYSPDGICESVAVTGNILIEVKCFNATRHLTIAKGEIPVEIMAQIQFGLFISGIREARLILYNPELDPQQAFKTLPIKANRNIHSNFKRILKEASHAFHTHTANA
jgi:hypothetical protein